jgi:Lysylphosphatidylglycerol synthase TM region
MRHGIATGTRMRIGRNERSQSGTVLMALARLLLVVVSVVLAVFLIALLVKVAKIDLRVTLQQLLSVSLISFTKLVLLNCLLVYFSSEKWRSIDAAWRRSSDSVPSRATSFALTSAGLALGIFVPAQFAMATARTLGTYVHGRALKRGTAGTLIEQSFDLLAVAFLAVASGATWFYRGGAVMWTVFAAGMTALALLAVRPSLGLIRWLTAYCDAKAAAPRNRILRSLSELQHSGLLNTGLACRLVMLSAARFVVVVLMSIQTAEAIGLHITLWQMAAAMPFVVIASVLALTPGGLGVNELTSVTALKIFGTPLAVGAQWALANRVLIAVSYLFVATCAAIMLGAEKIMAPRGRDEM